MPTLQDLIENYGISQPFGVEGPFGGGHTGVDIATPSGTSVPALGEGTISSIFYDATGGQQVKVKYASGAEGWFAHLGEVYSQVGERVDSSTIIARSGASGHVTGPHLHFEEKDPSGQLVDPLNEASQTYIGGGGDPECPPGWSRGIFGVCEPFNPGTARVGPVDSIVKGGADAVGGAASAAGAAVSGIPNAIGKLGEDLARGTKQLAIAGVIVGIVVVLGFSGVKRSLS